jgi:predicted acyl esterase
MNDRALRDEGIVFERSVAVPMRDGARLSVNIFRPAEGKRVPVIMSVTPYGKDKLPDRIGNFFMWLAGVRFGDIRISRYTGFEAPDPLYWVSAGYAVMQADVRGMHKSEGHAGVLTHQDAEDYYDLIEWAAAQSWCDGGVALSGVSYLAMSQWRVAPLKPPHLKAIVPWEGVSDLYREFVFQGGIPETGFIPIWWKNRMKRGRNRKFAMAEDFLAAVKQHPLIDAYWQAKEPALEKIDVPALVCASWSDQGLHTRGSFEAFARIGSTQKWLYTHGRKKWETYYSAESLATQKRFLDHFLKAIDNGWNEIPPVRIELRKAYYQHELRYEQQWPLPNTQHTPLYLDADNKALTAEPPAAASVAVYESRKDPKNAPKKARATFTYRFAEAVELTGETKLKLWVSTTEGDDLDLFIVLRKFSARGRRGKEIFFCGYNGYEKDAVAKGWLRVSHRALDPKKSRPSRPYHTHEQIEKLVPGRIVPVEIEILPSSTWFEAGSRLELSIQGMDAAKYPAFKHKHTVNRGKHNIHCGGNFDSHLLVPLIRGRLS